MLRKYIVYISQQDVRSSGLIIVWLGFILAWKFIFNIAVTFNYVMLDAIQYSELNYFIWDEYVVINL